MRLHGDTREVVAMEVVGADPSAASEGQVPQQRRTHYYRDRESRNWTLYVEHYSRVRFRDVYPGIDLVYYGSGSDLEYDFVVSPGADPNAIRLRFSAPARAMLRDDGALVLRTAAGAIVQRAPVVYQQASGRRVPVGGSYVQLGDNEFAFQVEGSPRGEKSGLKAGESIGVFYT